MRRTRAVMTAVAAGALVALTAAPAGATTSVSQLLPDPPAPGPNRCSVDIAGQNDSGYAAADNVVKFAYYLSGPTCKDAIYTLIIVNGDNARQRAVFAVRGDGTSSTVAFKQRLPFLPTTAAGAAAGSGLCVLAVTARAGRIQDVAPDQAGDVLTTLRSPECNSLTGIPARAFR
jgi:hypothetical protein